MNKEEKVDFAIADNGVLTKVKGMKASFPRRFSAREISLEKQIVFIKKLLVEITTSRHRGTVLFAESEEMLTSIETSLTNLNEFTTSANEEKEVTHG